MAPLASTENMFKNNDNPKASTEGALSVAIPGELKGYFEAKNRFGNPTITMLDLFQPTIDLCNEGFKVTHSLEQGMYESRVRNCRFFKISCSFIKPTIINHLAERLKIHILSILPYTFYLFLAIDSFVDGDCWGTECSKGKHTPNLRYDYSFSFLC